MPQPGVAYGDPGDARGPLLRAAGGADVSRLAVGRTAIMSYALSQQGGTVGLSSTADFSPQGLGADGQRIGALIGGAQSRGLPNFQALTARLVEVPSARALSSSARPVSSGESTMLSSNILPSVPSYSLSATSGWWRSKAGDSERIRGRLWKL